jgi:hypothetical protein
MMAFNSKSYRVLIASPSDLLEERQIASEAVNEWNAQHAAAEGIVLLPVKWESHAMPESGLRPQEAINRQLVQECDILVGMFWTRLGTATGVAASGTVEEVDEFVESGKPAMLYFSGRPVDPNKIDLEQHGKLRTFKDDTCAKALTGSFASPAELRETLLRDLTRQVRRLPSGKSSKTAKLEDAFRLTELIRQHKENSITPEEFERYRNDFLGPRRGSKRERTTRCSLVRWDRTVIG